MKVNESAIRNMRETCGKQILLIVLDLCRGNWRWTVSLGNCSWIWMLVHRTLGRQATSRVGACIRYVHAIVTRAAVPARIRGAISATAGGTTVYGSSACVKYVLAVVTQVAVPAHKGSVISATAVGPTIDRSILFLVL